MSGPVNFDGWSARPPVRLTATTGHPEGWGAAYADALTVLREESRAPEPATVRALAIGACLSAAWLRNQIVDGPGGTLVADTAAHASGGARPANTAPPDAEHESAARTLGSALETILIARLPAPAAARPLPPAAILAPSGTVDAAGFPQIVVITAIAAVAAYAIHEAGAVAERWTEERGRTKQLEAAHASAAELVRKHVEREREAGKSLPLDEATRLSLQGLASEQTATAARLAAPRTAVHVDGGSTAALLVAAAAVALFALSPR